MKRAVKRHINVSNEISNVPQRPGVVYEIFKSTHWNDRWSRYKPTGASIKRLQRVIDRNLVRVYCFKHAITIEIELS